MTLKLHNVVKKLRGKNIMCYYLNIFEDNLQGVIKIIFFFYESAFASSSAVIANIVLYSFLKYYDNVISRSFIVLINYSFYLFFPLVLMLLQPRWLFQQHSKFCFSFFFFLLRV